MKKIITCIFAFVLFLSACSPQLPFPLGQSPNPPPTAPAIPEPTFAPDELDELDELPELDAEGRMAVFEEAWNLVNDRYLYRDFNGNDWQAIHEEFAPRVATTTNNDDFYELMYELIDRLGDDHSTFLSPSEAIEEDLEFYGESEYIGIGTVIYDTDDGGLVVQLARGSPAEEAGIHLYDLILEIDGIPYNEAKTSQPDGAVSLLQGEEGTTVELRIRDQENQERNLTVTRGLISNSSFPNALSQHLADGRIGLLRIETFYADAVDQEVEAELRKLTANGPLAGLIIDVRDNGGGDIDLLLHTTALFVNEGSLGTVVSSKRRTPLWMPENRQIAEIADTPIIILIDQDTVSAAEMFAAAMRSLRSAFIIGQPSAGNVENVSGYDLLDGSRLWLAEVSYRTPEGENIEGQGIQPDQLVEGEWWQYAPANDPYILAALAHLIE